MLVDDQRRNAVVLFHHRLADLGAVPELVREALAIAIDQQTFSKGVGRVEETPGRGAVHVPQLAADTLTETNPHAVIARSTEREARHELWHVLGGHVAIEDESTGAEDEASSAPSSPRL